MPIPPLYQTPGTNFHDVNLDWIINQVKNCIAEWTETKAEWAATQEAWTEFQEYVRDYFANLDVDQAISDKIDAMAADGSLLTLIQDTVAISAADQADDWLAEHITQETGYVLDSSLMLSNAAAPAAKVGQIADYINLGYVTDHTDQTLTNGVALTFISPSKFSAVSDGSGDGTIKIPLMGNTAWATATFRPNLPESGSYYCRILLTGSVSNARVYLQYRTNGGSLTAVRDGNTITIDSPAEVVMSVTKDAMNGTFAFMLTKVPEAPVEPIEYREYGWVTAKDDIARAASLPAAGVPALVRSIEHGVTNVFDSLGTYPVLSYATKFKAVEIATIPGDLEGSATVYPTSGMASDGIRYLYIITKLSESGSGSAIIRKFDTYTGSFVAASSLLQGIGHGQTMCYRDGKLYISTWVTSDYDLVSAGGTCDRISVFDAETLSPVLDNGNPVIIQMGNLIPEAATYPRRIDALAWSDKYGCFVGITPWTRLAGAPETWTDKAILLFTETELIKAYTITNASGVIDGCLATPDYIVAMTTYQPTYIKWSTGESVSSWAKISKFLADVTDAGYVQEAESVCFCNGTLWVNSNVLLASPRTNTATKLYRVHPYQYWFQE